MKQKKLLSTAVAVTLVGSVVAGCGSNNNDAAESTSTPGAAAKVQEIKLNLSAEPEALDLSKSTTVVAASVLNAITDGLYRVDKEGKLQMGVAKDLPKISEDGLTYTIDLNPDAKWSDGKAVTAQDFVYSLQRTANPETKAQYSFLMEWLENGSEIVAGTATPDQLGAKALSDTQLEIKLVSPKGFFTEMLAFPTFFPQREDIVSQYGNKFAADADKVIGNGPFKLTTWNHEQNLTLEKNESYWDAANVKLNKINISIVKDAGTALNLYETKELDYTSISGDNIALYKDKPDLVTKPELTNSYIQYQTKDNPVFSNAKIRQALNMAIDKQGLVDVVLKNGSVPATGLVPNGTKDGNGEEFRKVVGDILPAYDVAKAKALLEEGMKEAGLTSIPKFKLTSDDTSAAKKSLEYVLSQWKTNLGVEAEAEPLPFAARVEKMKSRNFDAVIALWGADYNDPMTFLDLWMKDSSMNYPNYDSEAYTNNVKAAQKELDPAKRSQLLVDAEKQLIEDLPVGPLYFRSAKFLIRPGIENLILAPSGFEWDAKWAEVK
ncbi:peptide ABC transporter substrate-binding protein [Paenibacillus albiflavus]|uniref:Peptide ABC transporter substrate-binding protein n=1 Tax=Paenibacillus albiflavus TaxID=2545760 RepID=A0A4R4E8R0_9BACL|nr:peptide ABC transporter substrate-binding protein [Paenibacillus albiflavus]TCZ75547.1 peptide ABC transporter substrate-binding protein [Paenibacillus albiflavus]